MRYAADFQGWIYVDADDSDDANNKAWEILEPILRVLHNEYDGDWEFTNVEEAE